MTLLSTISGLFYQYVKLGRLLPVNKARHFNEPLSQQQ